MVRAEHSHVEKNGDLRRDLLWKRYFDPALTTLVLGLELELGLVYRSSFLINLERQLAKET